MADYFKYIIWILGLLSDSTFTTCSSETVHVAFLGPGFYDNSYPAAFVVGLWNVEQLGLLPGYDIKYVRGKSFCNGQRAIKFVVENWKQMGRLDAIIGDSCSIVCQPLALLSAAWNIPIVSNLCTSDALSDIATYPTFARVVGVYRNYLPLLVQITDVFNWKRVAIITSPYDLYHDLAVAARRLMKNHDISVHYYTVQPETNNDVVMGQYIKKLRSILFDIKKQSRIVFIMQFATFVRITLVTAYEEGMYNGEYMFLGLEANPDDAEIIYKPEIARDMLWQGFINMVETYRLSDKFQQFKNDCILAFRTINQESDAFLEPDDITQNTGMSSHSIKFHSYPLYHVKNH